MSETALIEAVKAGDYEQVRLLISNGADLNQGDDQGWTALNFAAGRGDLEMVRLLVESGADIFRTGRDKRTPFMIAVAAGRVATAQYLRNAEEQSTAPKPHRVPRSYCKAYRLGDLRSYAGWKEQRSNWTEADASGAAEPLEDSKIVFIHQDLSVTESMWHNENVLFASNDESWRKFCEQTLGFKALDDMDLMVSDQELSTSPH